MEYRRDENGTRILYEIAQAEPFGSFHRSYVQGTFANGEISFRIGFRNGLKDALSSSITLTVNSDSREVMKMEQEERNIHGIW